MNNSTWQEVSPTEWYALLAQFEDATIYQTRSYGACHWSPKQLRSLALHRNGRVLALAQLRMVRLPLLGKGIAYLRWGPLCRRTGAPFEPETIHDVLSALTDEFVRRRGLLLRLLPPVFQNDTHSAAFRSALASLGFLRDGQQRTFRTMRLDLGGSLESLRKGLDGKWRNMLNNAERNGLTIAEGADLPAYDRFLTVYREMQARKPFETTVDVNEFRNMQQDLPAPFKMQVFLCLKQDRVLNALVLSALGDSAIYLLGATSDEGLKLRGAYLLQWRAIQWLKERGCRCYDLGGVDPVRNPGVYHFKEGMGGQETEHLGTFEAGAGSMSALCVKTGERCQTLGRRLKLRFSQRKSGSPAEGGTRTARQEPRPTGG
jgi:lipid II:glycine glycyltransferase (peptidoglycan interpeptide bridge formation enzyme)